MLVVTVVHHWTKKKKLLAQEPEAAGAGGEVFVPTEGVTPGLGGLLDLSRRGGMEGGFRPDWIMSSGRP